MDWSFVAYAEGGIAERSTATQERNLLGKNKWYHASRRKALNTIVHCRHGLDPNCSCVQNFLVDKTCPLTEQQAKVGAASLIRSEIEKLNILDPRYVPLTKIIKCREDEQDSCIRRYESIYGPLLTEDIFEVDSSIAHLKSPTSVTESIRYDIKLVLSLSVFRILYSNTLLKRT
jgi:hypothetical protein